MVINIIIYMKLVIFTDDNNKLKNSYNYKKNFGGEVVELVGEYDLVIDPKYTDMARKHFSRVFRS